MKFSHQIQFNSVPDWTDYYLPYSNLKKQIYQIEKDRLIISSRRASIDEEAGERTALISDNPVEADNQSFMESLNKSLEKISKFYAKKETELYDELDKLIDEFEHANQSSQHGQTHPVSPHRHPNEEDDDFMQTTVISNNMSDMDPISEHYDDLKRRIVDMFVLLSELKSFVALNLTAFAKILKKYDKITNSDLKRYYTSNYVMTAYPFQAVTKSRLNERIQQTERAYAILATYNDLDQAIEELKTHLREHIVWERNTVWRDLIGQERRTQTVGVKPTSIYTPFGTLQITREQVMSYFYLIVCLVVFIVLLKAELFDTVEQNRCLAILVFASMLWAGEVM